MYLNDGSVEEDIDYIDATKNVRAYFDFEDNESGYKSFRYQVWQLFEGNLVRVQPLATQNIEYKTEDNPSVKKIVHKMEKVVEGSRIHVTVAAMNNAGLEASFDSDGVTVDSTPPTVRVTIMETCNCSL